MEIQDITDMRTEPSLISDEEYGADIFEGVYDSYFAGEFEEDETESLFEDEVFLDDSLF